MTNSNILAINSKFDKMRQVTDRNFDHVSQVRRMGDGVWDVNSIAEEDFEQLLAVYLVPDQPYDENSKVKRAEATLPRNLVLKPTQAHGQPNNVS